MKYKGKELKEFTSDKPVVFDPPKKMVVWDDDLVPRYRRGGHRVNMERELEKIRKEREDRTRTAPCWDCCRFENCGKTAEMCKMYRGTEAPVKE